MKMSQVNWILALALAALPAFGQTSQSAPPSQPQQPAAATQPQAPAAQQPPQKQKKVWTNEDLEQLPGNSPVSTASAAPEAAPAEGEAAGGEKGAAAGAGGAAAKPAALPKEKDPKYYQEKLDALRKRLAQVEANIQSTQGAMSGGEQGSNAVTLNQATPILRPTDQLAALEKERDDLQQQIDELESEARKNGLNPGDIR